MIPIINKYIKNNGIAKIFWKVNSLSNLSFIPYTILPISKSLKNPYPAN